jgi:hypothetical protein
MSSQDSKCTIFIISYVPLCNPIDGIQRFNENIPPEDFIKKFGKEMDDANNAVSGVGWTLDHEPVFIMPDAIKVAKHLEEWCEGNVGEWFKLLWFKDNDRYCLVLQPNLEKSIARQKLAYNIYTGKNYPDDAKYVLLFKPLTFVSSDNKLFNNIRDKIPTNVKIRFIENMDSKEYLLNSTIPFVYEDSKFMRSQLIPGE